MLLVCLILTGVSFLLFMKYFVLHSSYSAEEKDPEELEENDFGGDGEEDDDEDEEDDDK